MSRRSRRSSSVPFCLSRLPLGAHTVSLSSFSCWYGLCCKPESYHLLKMGTAADPAWISPSNIDYSSLFRGNWSTCYLVSQSRQIKTCSSIELRGALSLVLGVWEFELLCDIFSPRSLSGQKQTLQGAQCIVCVDLFAYSSQMLCNLFSVRPKQRLGNSPAVLFFNLVFVHIFK